MNELQPACYNPDCLFNIGKRVSLALTVWPQRLAHEKRNNMHVWDIYFSHGDTPGISRGTQRRSQTVCNVHHEKLVTLWESSIKDDIAVMNQTEAWAIKNGGNI